jgi:hypothetical protein
MCMTSGRWTSQIFLMETIYIIILQDSMCNMEKEAGSEPHFPPAAKLTVMDSEAHVSDICILPQCTCTPHSYLSKVSSETLTVMWLKVPHLYSCQVDCYVTIAGHWTQCWCSWAQVMHSHPVDVFQHYPVFIISAVSSFRIIKLLCIFPIILI